MNKILIDGEDFENRGFMAVITGLITSLYEYNNSIDITIMSASPSSFSSMNTDNFHVIKTPWAWPQNERGAFHIIKLASTFALHYMYCFLKRVNSKLNSRVKPVYDEYDLIIHFIVDWSNESDVKPIKTIAAMLWLLAMQAVFHKPICIIPSGMGPFRTNLTKFIAKFVFNRTDIIMLREPTSYSYIKELNLTKPQIILLSDLAFLLNPADKHSIAVILQREEILINGQPFVGITPNRRNGEILGLNKNGQLNYAEVISRLADYISDKINANVCLIPHVYDFNDIELCQQIKTLTKATTRLNMLTGKYTSAELKGIIGSCDLFIGSWMHSTIAATSMGIPTIAIAFADKFYRLIGDTMGQKEYIVDIRRHNSDTFYKTLITKVDKLWLKRDTVTAELLNNAKYARAQAILCGKILNEFDETLNDKYVQ